MRQLMMSTLGAALLTSAAAQAQLESPRPDVYDVSGVTGDWFLSEAGSQPGSDMWLLRTVGRADLPAQCQVQLSPTEWFTPSEYAPFVMAMPAEEYETTLRQSSPFPITSISERQITPLDGVDAISHTVDMSAGDRAVRMLTVQTYRADNIVMIRCALHADLFERHRAEFETFVREIDFAD